MEYDEHTKEVPKVAGNKYQSILNEKVEKTQWRHGAPPIFNAVNMLFEEGRTQVHDVFIDYDA